MRPTAYEIREKTDSLSAPDPGSAIFEGTLAEAVSYIEKEQLLSPKLWTLLVDQFRSGYPDDRDKGWRGEYWGKMMRGACFTYAYTQNESLYRVLTETVRDILSTADIHGRITTYSVENEFHGWDIWCRKYVLLGLQYFLEICNDEELCRDIVLAMCRETDYLILKLGNDEVGKLPVTNTSEWWNGLNSSSVLEPVVRLYFITGDKKYLDFAKSIIDAGGCRGFNIFEAALEGKLYPYEYPVTKAYEMISNFEGIIEYYRATGEKKYFTMAKNFARLVAESDITVIGCAGTTHELFDHSRVRQFDPAFDGIMQETCVTVTWMKFCFQMLCLTGDPTFADRIEISAYNALYGAVNREHRVCRDQAYAFDSYSPLLNGHRGRAVGGRKDIIPDKLYWGCCVAIGSAGTALVPMCAVMRSTDGAAINLYLPGRADVKVPNGKITLVIETEYPKNGRISVTVRTDTPVKTSLSLRIPEWSRKTSLAVNGVKENHVTNGTYAVIDREWKDGDSILLCLDMRTRIIRAADIDPAASKAAACHAALQRGPVMLARDSQFGENVTEGIELCDADGYADIEECPAPFKCIESYKVKTRDGYIKAADYASCGQSWKAELPITVWITTKE